jgi:hypothetical protein
MLRSEPSAPRLLQPATGVMSWAWIAEGRRERTEYVSGCVSQILSVCVLLWRAGRRADVRRRLARYLEALA